MRGNECWYVCADDTHGTPIMLRAEKEGITPEAADRPRASGEHSRDFAGFHVGFDNYCTRTRPRTAPRRGHLRQAEGAGLIEPSRTIEQFTTR